MGDIYKLTEHRVIFETDVEVVKRKIFTVYNSNPRTLNFICINIYVYE